MLPRPNRTVRTLVSVVIIGVFLAMWVYRTYLEKSVNPITYAVVVLYALASGYAVFGKRVMTDAVETYETVKGDGDEPSEPTESDASDDGATIAETSDDDPGGDQRDES